MKIPSPPPASELPPEFRSAVDALNLVPAWTQLRAVMPVGQPRQQALAMSWKYQDLRPLMLKAAELVTAERAERRVLGLVNPGIATDIMTTMPSIFFGLQLILPGERAPNHRHLAAAARIFLEGNGAYTTVDGEKIAMEPGDVILTPPRTWHDHGNEGSSPAIWMDVLDVPLAVPLDVSYVTPGKLTTDHADTPDSGDTFFRCAGVIPYRRPSQQAPEYPLCCYRWSKVRAALDATGAATSEAVHLAYVNPTTGESAFKTLGFSARLLRAGETVAPIVNSANHVLLALGSRSEVEINGNSFELAPYDTVTIPTHARVKLHNPSAAMAAYLIQVDDIPLQSKLGLYDEFE